jgi:hypothetical protein
MGHIFRAMCEACSKQDSDNRCIRAPFFPLKAAERWGIFQLRIEVLWEVGNHEKHWIWICKELRLGGQALILQALARHGAFVADYPRN